MNTPRALTTAITDPLPELTRFVTVCAFALYLGVVALSVVFGLVQVG